MNVRQLLNCFTLGSYRVRVVGGELHIRGPLPMAGDLPDGVRKNKAALIEVLECGGGTWPPVEGSELYEYFAGNREDQEDGTEDQDDQKGAA